MQENFPETSTPAGVFTIQDIQDTNLSPEEKLNKTRERYRETAAIRRAFMPTERLDMERKRGREYMALKRAFMTTEEREIHNKRNRERVRLKRMYLPEEKKDSIRKMQRERLQRKRAEMTEEEKLQKREKWRVQMQQKRAAFSEEEKNRLRAYNREKAREYRHRKQQVQEEQQQLGADFTGVWPPYDVYQPGVVGQPDSQHVQSDQGEAVPEQPIFPTPLNDAPPNDESSTSLEEEDSRPRSEAVKEEVTDPERTKTETAVKEEVTDPEQTKTETLPTSMSGHPNSAWSGEPATSADSNTSALPPSIQKPFQIVYKAVNKLRKFSQEHYQTEEFERFDRSTLNTLLGEFYASVEQLPWMGLQMTEFVIVMREGLVCFMRDFLQLDIENDPDFEEANRKFCRRLESLMEKAASQSSVEDDSVRGSGQGGGNRASHFAPPELRVDEEATARVVQFFRSYLVSQGKSDNFEKFPKEALNEVLYDFYIHAKMLPQRSLPDPYRILRLRLAHHMKITAEIDIVHDPAFQYANSICKLPSGKISTESPHHMVPVTPKDEISCEDMVKFLSSDNLNPGQPQGLLNLCMFNVVFHLCRSIHHGLADLMRLMDKDTFLLEKDDKNVEHIAWQSTYIERMPEIVGHSLCPVANFKMYLSKLNPHTNTLWQHPLKKPAGSNIWYHANIPVGSRKMQLFVDRLSREVGLQATYSISVLQRTPLRTMTNAMQRVRAKAAAIQLRGLPPTPVTQRKQRKRGLPKGVADGPVTSVHSLNQLESCLNLVDWGNILPEWTQLKLESSCASDVDFLRHLLGVYEGHVLGTASVGPSGAMAVLPGHDDPVVGFIPANMEQSAERQERARRLDAFLAPSTRSSSRRKSSVVQRRGAACRKVNVQSDTDTKMEPLDFSGGAVSEMAGNDSEQYGVLDSPREGIGGEVHGVQERHDEVTKQHSSDGGAVQEMEGQPEGVHVDACEKAGSNKHGQVGGMDSEGVLGVEGLQGGVKQGTTKHGQTDEQGHMDNSGLVEGEECESLANGGHQHEQMEGMKSMRGEDSSEGIQGLQGWVCRETATQDETARDDSDTLEMQEVQEETTPAKEGDPESLNIQEEEDHPLDMTVNVGGDSS